MKKVLLLAYTNVNFGDDMFIKTICLNFPDVDFYIEAPSYYNEILKDIKNIQIIEQSLFNKIILVINKIIFKISKKEITFFRNIFLQQFDAVVYVVGALFDEDDLWEQELQKVGYKNYKSRILRKSFNKKIPFYLLGCNVTRVKTEKYIKLMHYIFEGIKDICFRDTYSYNLFNLCNTRCAPDIVFNYPVQKKENFETVLISIWGVLLKSDNYPQWNWAKTNWESYKQFIISCVEYCLSQGYNVKLLSLCEKEGDLDACRVIVDVVKSKNVTIVNYEGNLSYILDVFADSTFIVGTRFHSVVLSLNLGIPMYPIIYESKTLQLLKDCHYNGNYSQLDKIDANETVKFIESFNSGYVCNVDSLKREAMKQFAELKTDLNLM